MMQFLLNNASEIVAAPQHCLLILWGGGSERMSLPVAWRPPPLICGHCESAAIGWMHP
ncbi:hypothetical protein MES5069_20032 [Mesorhizobium escarrei]|uniref:Uncharacterized protein n=1 Tax=Mesorhizobium escarrei TaxID=666018 RepID=A0ABM9DNS7_9HYPH|nr:hypothetical protein MES5069_20032 [Mesorhizobium escarrei]